MKDYFADALAYINNPDNPIKKDKPEPQKRDENKAECIKPYADLQTPYISPSGKSVYVSEDAESIIVEGQTFITPEFYSKERLKQKDERVIEMILYHYGITP